MEIWEKLCSITLSRDQKTKLLPFFVTLGIYFLLYVPLTGYPVGTIGSVFFKLLPIYSLALYISYTSNNLPLRFPKNFEELIPEDHRACHFFFALLVSSLGDACLGARKILFLPGVLFFAIAQILYLIGLDTNLKESKSKSFFILLGMNTYLCVQTGMESYIMKAVIAIYVVLIFSVGWKATVRYEAEGSKAALVGAVGAAIFILSDFMIAVDRWNIQLPFVGFLVMATYYGAQFGLALSTTKDLQ